MSFTTKKSPAATTALTAADIGSRKFVRLVSGFRTHKLTIRVTGTLTLAGGPATGLRNGGSILAAFDQFGMEDNGDDIAKLSGLSWRTISEMVAPAPLTAVRLSSFANGAYVLSETFVIPFTWPLGVSPNETPFVERDPRNALQAFAVYNGIGANLVTTAGTATLSGVSFEVLQSYDNERMPPLYIPRYRSILEPISGTVAELPIYIKTDKLLRGVIVGGYAITVGNQADIISRLALRSDDREIIGPAQGSWDQLTRATELEFAGNLFSLGPSATVAQPDSEVYLPINFQESGRLSNVLNPNHDRNLRAVISAAPTGAAGAGSTLVEIVLMELKREPGVTSDAIPFDV